MNMAWPEWLETLTNLSHFLTTFNSSVAFFIYFAKHFNSIVDCGRVSSNVDTSNGNLKVNAKRLENNLRQYLAVDKQIPLRELSS
jgi:hypothetical protein